VCVVGKMRDLILQLSKSSIYSTKPFEIVRPPFGPATWYAWAGRKDADSASLVKFISDGIVQLNKSGKLAQLQTKWLGFSMAVPEQVPTPAN
ncbi:hypothetical protein POW75_26430, partial [Klebsiella pneumoniae]